jgi:hypothetical protein
MQNYHFSRLTANNITLSALFKTLYLLIELERQVTILRATGNTSDLTYGGICRNFNYLVDKYVGTTSYHFLGRLFWGGRGYPITPYANYASDTPCQWMWNGGKHSELRVKYLAQMIQDLTHYLSTTKRTS